MRPTLTLAVFTLPALLALPAATSPAHAPASAPPATHHADSGVAVTFLANEGVMLRAGSAAVVIDGLFRAYDDYAVPPDSIRLALEAARPPFDGVDLVLVTHRHGDHFHPAPVAAHLRANPGSTLLASRQVLDSLAPRLDSGAVSAGRLRARPAAPGSRRREVVGEITVEAIAIPHVNRRHRGVEHLAFLVDIGGRRVLHLGDADVTEAALAPLRLDTARVDVVMLPYWVLLDEAPRRAVERWIRPRHVLAFHLSPRDVAGRARAVRAAMPAAVVLAHPLQTVRR